MPVADIPKKAEEKADFVMRFVAASDRALQQLRPRWEESLANYFVRPYGSIARGQRTDRPLDFGFTSSTRRRSILKDPESHQIVETYLAKLWLALFSGERVITASPVGIEDTGSGDVVSRLLEYVLSIPGHPRATYVWLKDALIFGTGVIFSNWDFREDFRDVRQVEVDPFLGIERDVTTTQLMTVYDDPRLLNVDIMDFYPDPGQHQMELMQGVARRFRISESDMLRLSKDNPTWDRAAVKRAIVAGKEDESSDKQTFDTIKEIDQADEFDDFKPLIGYEYHGEVPWKVEGQEHRRQVLTVVNGELIRERNWILPSGRVPANDITIRPVNGRFHGFSPLEAAHRDQDFLDGLKMHIADAVNLATNPPHIYDKNAEVELGKLLAFNPNIPIGAMHTEAVKTLPYDPPIGMAMAAYQMVKQQEREGSGAIGAVQGLGLGTKRFSATEAQFTAGEALDRPEMMASLMEQNDLPGFGQSLFGLYQKFLREPEEIALRVGEHPGPAGISSILGDFDIRFVGSRRQSNRGAKIASMERFVQAVGGNPLLAARVPWDLWLEEYVKELDLPNLRAAIGTEQTTLINIMLQRVLDAQSQIGNGNGEQPRLNAAPNEFQAAGRVV